jgi:hypothetical protein
MNCISRTDLSSGWSQLSAAAVVVRSSTGARKSDSFLPVATPSTSQPS